MHFKRKTTGICCNIYSQLSRATANVRLRDRLRESVLVAVSFRSLSINVCYKQAREWQRYTQTCSGVMRLAWPRPLAERRTYFNRIWGWRF